MIVYLLTPRKALVGQVDRILERLHRRDPSCRVAVIDSAAEPLPRRPTCDFYRTRPCSGSAWKDEVSALAAVITAFPSARWIGRLDALDLLPELPRGGAGLDCWLGESGYFLRSTFVRRLREAASGGANSSTSEQVFRFVTEAGGRSERRQAHAPDQGYVSSLAISSRMPMRARAFCTVATRDVIGEVEILLRTLRRHHQEALVLVCDEEVEALARKTALPGIEIEPITPELRAWSEQISRRVIRHDPYWKPEAIALKFHALRTAIRRHGPTHLLDADITVAGSLHAGGPWAADLVLSPFYWLDPAVRIPVAHGFFNAGYLLARNTRIVDRWERLYTEGVGGFYEQKNLETLGREFATAWFGHEHNFAKWRWESPACRPVVSFHHKLRAKGKAPRILDMSEAVTNAFEVTGAPRKIAHVHCVRSWGSYLRCLIRERICPALGLQNLVSWDLGLQREWSEAELLLLAEGKLWGQHPGGCGFVHNHTFGWTERALDAFHENGWLTVALVRDPREVLVSLASWALDAMNRGQPCPVWHREDIDNSALSAARTVEEAVIVLLNDPDYHTQWVLPPWLGKVKWIRRACPEAIDELCREVCGLPEGQELGGFRNESSSPGWDSAPLSIGVRRLVETHPEVRAWDEFLGAL